MPPKRTKLRKRRRKRRREERRSVTRWHLGEWTCTRKSVK